MTMPSAKRKPGSVPSPNKGSINNAQPFNPPPAIKGANSTSGESQVEAAKTGTAPDINKS